MNDNIKIVYYYDKHIKLWCCFPTDNLTGYDLSNESYGTVYCTKYNLEYTIKELKERYDTELEEKL